MTTIPNQNQRHIRRIVRETLPDDARPDFRPQNRWYVATIDEDYDDQLDDVRDTLRAEGYKVSVVSGDVKVTRRGLNWPDPDQ